MAEYTPLEIPNINGIEPPIEVDPVTQYNAFTLPKLVASYTDRTQDIARKIGPAKERALGIVDVDELVLGMLGVKQTVDEGSFGADTPVSAIDEDSVKGLIALWRRARSEHEANPSDKRLTFREYELHFVLRELGQVSFLPTEEPTPLEP